LVEPVPWQPTVTATSGNDVEFTGSTAAMTVPAAPVALSVCPALPPMTTATSTAPVGTATALACWCEQS
jgi:hypothetical protein